MLNLIVSNHPADYPAFHTLAYMQKECKKKICFLKLFFYALFSRFLNAFIFFIVFQYVKNIFRFVFQIKTLKIKEKFLSIAPVLTQKVTK